MKKILALLSKIDLAEIAVNWTIYQYGRILISRESFQNAAWMIGTFSNEVFTRTVKNYMTPVGVSDRSKSKFCSLESEGSPLNSALSWNAKLNIFHSQCYISFDQSLFNVHMREEKK